MTEEQASRLITEEDVRQVAGQAAHAKASAEGWLSKARTWEKKARDLAEIRDVMREFIGRPLSDIKAELAKAEEHLAELTDRVELLKERQRDIEGYRRILKEQHPELAAGDNTAAIPDQSER